MVFPTLGLWTWMVLGLLRISMSQLTSLWKETTGWLLLCSILSLANLHSFLEFVQTWPYHFQKACCSMHPCVSILATLPSSLQSYKSAEAKSKLALYLKNTLKSKTALCGIADKITELAKNDAACKTSLSSPVLVHLC